MTPSIAYRDNGATIWHGDCREVLRGLDESSVHCVVTSPPYWGLRDYGAEGQLGLEETPADHVANMVDVFREVRRVLRDDGTLWLNLGDSYAATRKGSGGVRSKQPTNSGAFYSAQFDIGPLKPKDLCGHSVARSLRATRRRLVAAARYYLAQAKPDAGKLYRQVHQGPRIYIPSGQVFPVLLRRGRGEGEL